MSKKFEINPNTTVGTGKKFQIHRKFEITGGLENRKKWSQQKNSSDCGPCMLLNSLAILNIQDANQDIQSVRAKVNSKRQERGASILAGEGWFTTSDVREYLEEHDFNVSEYTAKPEDPTEVARVLEKLDAGFDLVYTTFPGSHFRSIVKIGDQYLLLDSFQNGPQPLTIDQLKEIVRNTIRAGVHSNGSRERIGIAKKLVA